MSDVRRLSPVVEVQITPEVQPRTMLDLMAAQMMSPENDRLYCEAMLSGKGLQTTYDGDKNEFHNKIVDIHRPPSPGRLILTDSLDSDLEIRVESGMVRIDIAGDWRRAATWLDPHKAAMLRDFLCQYLEIVK